MFPYGLPSTFFCVILAVTCYADDPSTVFLPEAEDSIPAQQMPPELARSAALIARVRVSLTPESRLAIRFSRAVKGAMPSGDVFIEDTTLCRQWLQEAKLEEDALLFSGIDSLGRRGTLKSSFIYCFSNDWGHWLQVFRAKSGLAAGRADAAVTGHWMNSVHMLEEAVRFCRRYPSFEWMTVKDVRLWAPSPVAAVKGRAGWPTALWHRGEKCPIILLPRDDGDMAFRWSASDKRMSDVTKDLGLRSQSQLMAVVASGAEEGYIVSGSGRRLAVLRKSARGQFDDSVFSGEAPAEVLTLAPICLGRHAKLACAAGTRAGPCLLVATTQGDWQLVRLPNGKPSSLGKSRGSAVGLFSDDSLPDILDVCEKGLMLHAGKPDGGFDEPTIAATFGPGKDRRYSEMSSVSHVVSDFSEDGRADILLAFAGSEDGNQGISGLWVNDGGGKFNWSPVGDLLTRTCDYAVPWSAEADSGERGILGLRNRDSLCLFRNEGFLNYQLAPVEAFGSGNIIMSPSSLLAVDVDGDSLTDVFCIRSDGRLVLLRGRP